MSEEQLQGLSSDEAFYLLVLLDGEVREHGDLYTDAEKRWRGNLRDKLREYLFGLQKGCEER